MTEQRRASTPTRGVYRLTANARGVSAEAPNATGAITLFVAGVATLAIAAVLVENHRHNRARERALAAEQLLRHQQASLRQLYMTCSCSGGGAFAPPAPRHLWD